MKIRTGGKRAKQVESSSLSRRSAMSDDRSQLKRNASENLKVKRSKQSHDLQVGGEKLRDKNAQDYLETIRENEQLMAKLQKKKAEQLKQKRIKKKTKCLCCMKWGHTAQECRDNKQKEVQD